MSRVALVTGAEGFIGTRLTGFLVEKGWTVVAGCLRRSDSRPRHIPTLHRVGCDVRDRKQLDRVLGRFCPTHVFHLAAQSSPEMSHRDPVGTFETNVMGSLHLLEAAGRMKRPPMVILACSSAEYGHITPSRIPVTEKQPLKPLQPYGISKVCLELLARRYFLDRGLPAIILRLFNTTGPGKLNDAPSDFVRQLVAIRHGARPPVVEVGNLCTQRSFLHVDDAVRGFYLAALRGVPGEVYNLCGARVVTIEELLHLAMRLSGVQAEIRTAHRLVRPNDEKVIFGSTRKLRGETGWKATVPLSNTLRDTVRYWELRRQSGSPTL